MKNYSIFSFERSVPESSESLVTIQLFASGTWAPIKHLQWVKLWAKLFEGRLTLTQSYILTRVSFSFAQKHFPG